jgi:hypothetical protein
LRAGHGPERKLEREQSFESFEKFKQQTTQPSTPNFQEQQQQQQPTPFGLCNAPEVGSAHLKTCCQPD